MKFRFIAFWLSLWLMLSFLTPTAWADNSGSPVVERYVVFGDSIAIGFEPGMTTSSVPYGYSDRIYEQALLRGRATYANYGLGGLTSTGFGKLMQAVVDAKKVTGADIQPSLADPRADQVVSDTAKIKADLAAATLVTITIGGNDIGASIVTELQTMSDADLEAYAASWMKTYTSNVTLALQNLFTVNKNAKVYIADQYSPVPQVLKDAYPKAQKLKETFTATLKQIEQSFRKDGFNLTAVPVADAYVGLEGFYTHINEKDIHPNQSGYQVMAEIFAKSIWGGYRKDITAAEPITVVLNGRTLQTKFLPVLLLSSTFVPLREYSEEGLGATVDWDVATSTATVRYNGKQVDLTVHATTYVVNGVTKKLPDDISPPQSIESNGEMKTYIPLRLLAEGLGFDVQYIGQSRTAYINK